MTTMIRISLLLLLSVFLLACSSAIKPTDTGNTGRLGQEKEESAADVYVKMGVEYMRFGKYTIALQKLNRGLDIDPNNAQLHNILGIVYQQLGEAGPAREHFEKAVSLAGEDPYIHNAYGGFLCQNNDYDGAVKEFMKAIENPLNPAPWIAYTNAGICASDLNKLVVSEEYLRRALQMNPLFASALKTMMIVKYKSGNAFRSRAYLQRFEQVADHDAETLYYAYKIQIENNKPGKAESYARKLLKLFPDSREALLYEKGGN
jgi:type IV pilus assembly protein PilF